MHRSDPDCTVSRSRCTSSAPCATRRASTAGTLTDAERTPPFGRRLRSLSLDELPELWNVLRGDMSLVGPRPLLMQYLSRYTPEQSRRHDVRPGVTGLAQVSGRNALTWDQKFALDLEYVDHHDLPMDLSILVRTARVVLAREGIRHDPGSRPTCPNSWGPKRGTARRRAKHDVALQSDRLQTPLRPAGALPPAAWNDTDRDYPAVLLHEAFEAQVATTADAIAVRFRDEMLTYAELDTESTSWRTA